MVSGKLSQCNNSINTTQTSNNLSLSRKPDAKKLVHYWKAL